ncbi:ribosome assembly protein RRB1 [Tritrichomonas foetus]|uniref:Ribosome assembly protein RRB1 n=1 Tax=Tritrichomonas foetus TaxID=1144522 RepID=A0A1J4JIV1_9EUKA|nr:ribosome assembly protein RRB1 [Tritrichomonas foetus]|eukprot:OHS99066.1 ribosome assembly protein RRB1 [Tritrichomonas foetus]
MDGSDEEFGFTNSIYRQYFQMNFEWPCLSFDVLRDELGANRVHFPHTAYFVAATQADSEDENQLLVTKISEMQCTKFDDEIDDESKLVDAKVRACGNFHPAAANRVRSMPQQSNIVATWSDQGVVLIWDVSAAIQASGTDSGQGAVQLLSECPNDCEGFGLAWSKVSKGILAVGNNDGKIGLWSELSGGFVNQSLFDAHTDSVEDIIFSPTDDGVFASCMCGGFIAIWDSRDLSVPVAKFQAYQCDCNVIDWNPNQTNLLVSGSDEGVISIWDLRAVSQANPSPIGTIEYHTDAITSIEWNPHDESEFAVSSADGRVTIWDLSVEALDPDEKEEGIPDQMMFEHVHEDPKELHYHPQIPSMIAVTGATFDVFIPDIEGDAGDEAQPPEGYVPQPAEEE